MIVNCAEEKTEIICFGTAENDASLVPDTFKLGNSSIRFVEKTKVLGLIMDQKLSYIEHAKYVNRKISFRWVSICKHTNRNWGFRQHVIVRLIEVLIATCIHYAGTIWMNFKSLQEIHAMWYKCLKSATGAVFNVRLSLVEVILGVLPINVCNRIYGIKQLLKLNIEPQENDPLRDLVNNQLVENKYCPLSIKVKDMFGFLKWKMVNFSESFTLNDTNIVNNMEYTRFSELSGSACNYSKNQITAFSEILWQDCLDSELKGDGVFFTPTVSTKKLKLPVWVDRKLQTSVLSLFYPNNLQNEFLHRFNKERFPTPVCFCGSGEQNSFHLLLSCLGVSEEKRGEMERLLEGTQYDTSYYGNSLLLSKSRDERFIELCVDIISDIHHRLRTEIVL